MRAIETICGLAAAALLICGDGGHACAEDAATLIARCDAAAVSDLDPGKPAGLAGVRFYDIDPEVAVPACEMAAKSEPNNSRIAFEYARALDAQHMRQDATLKLALTKHYSEPGVEASRRYKKASALGSPVAQYVLCIANITGVNYSDHVDACQAAARVGFVPAMTSYALRNLRCYSGKEPSYLKILDAAAVMGDYVAMRALEQFYRSGRYPHDPVQAQFLTMRIAMSAPPSTGSLIPPTHERFEYIGGCTF